MSSHFFAMISRMKYIERWGLMRNTERENLSEHSLDVALIAHALCVIKNRRLGGNVNADRAAAVALYHDMSEILTGDLPTPIKYYSEDIRKVYKDIEATAGRQLCDMLPTDMREDFESLFVPQDKEIEQIVRAADKISALIKCKKELAAGNSEFAFAEQSTRRAIDDMHLPEAEIFLSEFLESYTLPIDDITLKD